MQTNITGVWGKCLQCLGHTGFAPAHGVFAFLVYTALKLQVALQGNCPKQALGFVHSPGLSRSGSGSQVLHEGTDLVGHFMPRSEQLRYPSAWRVPCPRWTVF